MQVLPISAPVPAGATDFAVGVVVSHIAWVSNRVIVLNDGDCMLIPKGWEAAHDPDTQAVIIYFDHTVEPEVPNA